MVLSVYSLGGHCLYLICRPTTLLTASLAYCCRVTGLLTFACPLQVKTAVDDALEWLDDNQDAEEDDYREKLKEVEDTCSPIVSAAYQAGGGPGGDDEDLEDHDEL